MYITPEQLDALSELINMGYGRASATLSILVGQRVLLEAPRVEILSIPELRAYSPPLTDGNEIIVEQSFQGALSGNSLLVMNKQRISILVNLFCGGEGEEHAITDYDNEAMLEIGNILLSSCIGSLGNILKSRIQFSVPNICQTALNDVLLGFEAPGKNDLYTLLVRTEFHFANRSVGGCIILLMGIKPLEELLRVTENVSPQ